ncbi:HNH endonuclease [Paraburkholderia aspalathi]|uniref:HNH nuclease domain-containing protein n=1 Tax=Paraburkholderia aspalathi TaxID=1324617 RepID=A0A1I7B6V5_9BURK|nr:HNH endonuclease [Paraburkholderia aspalathi]SFT82926.1 hypothetical protein SAMN05192563_1004232 [Paraburkholderia aspalathi]
MPEKAPVITPTTPLDALLARMIDAQNPGRPPARTSEIAERYERDGELVRLLKEARGGKCQFCGHSFKTPGGGTYTEAHHLEQLANGGLDVSHNMLILCANHHRQFHFGYVKILHRDPDTITVRLDDEVHTIALGFVAPTEQPAEDVF